jgi:Domain of unknown function (DUF4166)/Saccharopine dehydrogenase NADP binding domain
MKILILGGYGVFGGRLATLLSDRPELDLLIAGRNLQRAGAFCTGWTGQARVRPLAMDRADIRTALETEQPDLVVDASGPFQDYGPDGDRVISACIDAGVDYLDFADASRFVFGVPQFDERAKAAGVFVITGVSSFPVLTGAVLREMARTMDIVDVEGGIAPSPFAGIGLNVMRAVVGYAGSPVRLRRGGRDSFGIGLAESRRFTVAVPGRLPLRNIRFSLVDVPDLQVLPPEHPTITDIWMGAGPVPEVLHRTLNLLAKARARLHLPSLLPFSRLFYFVLNRMRFGEHRGGMYVKVRGKADGRMAERSWHLLAEEDDGPFIPSMAIEAIVRKLVAGQSPAPGARSGVDALSLADYESVFAGRKIFTGFREEEPTAPLYRRVLGSAFEALPRTVQQLHDSHATRAWQGVANVRRGRGPVANAIASLFRFPPSGDNVPVRVGFSPHEGYERWTRTFGKRSFTSLQGCGEGRNQHLLVERFGIATFGLALVIEGDRLHLIPRRWSVAGVPMPAFMLPRGTSYETEVEGRFRFDVTIELPVIGKIVAYNGHLEPA